MLGEHLTAENTSGYLDNEAIALMESLGQLHEKRDNSQRLVQELRVSLRPSSSSSRQTELVAGFCKNVSRAGCCVVGESAPRVGDVYRFELNSDTTHPLHGTHARCVRCHLVDEDAFDSGFSFLSPVDLRDAAATLTQINDFNPDSGRGFVSVDVDPLA